MGFFNRSGGGMNSQRGENFEYYAVIEKSGLFFSGEMPDISWSKVNFCDSYDELIEKLSEKLRDEQRKPFSTPPKTSYQQMQAKYPGKQIVAITPNGVSRGPGFQHESHTQSFGAMNPRASGCEYYAWVEQSALFFSGEMPDISFSKVSLCSSYDELVGKLTEKLTETYRRWGNNMPAKTPHSQMTAKYPGKKIIAIFPDKI